MNPSGGRRDRRATPSGGRGALANPAVRGGLLIGLAIVIGIVLLQAIDDGNSGPIGDGSRSTTSTTAPATSSSTGGDDTSSTTAKPTTLAPADTTVTVLNGSGVQGAATTVTNTLGFYSQHYNSLTSWGVDAKGEVKHVYA